MDDSAQFIKNFGRRVSEIRKQKGITQEQLADEISVHRTYIGFIEQGKCNPILGNLYKISKALKVDVSDLLKGL